MKQRRRFFIPACVLGGLFVLCVGVYGLMQYFGSPLLPGSLECRYTREVSSHRQELLEISQTCLETGKTPEDLPLANLVDTIQVIGYGTENAFVDFFCHGWGLVPSSSYYGFYYSPQGPQSFWGGEEELLPTEDGGYAWQGEGDNHGFTRQIGENFYYYEGHF